MAFRKPAAIEGWKDAPRAMEAATAQVLRSTAAYSNHDSNSISAPNMYLQHHVMTVPNWHVGGRFRYSNSIHPYFQHHDRP